MRRAVLHAVLPVIRSSFAARAAAPVVGAALAGGALLGLVSGQPSAQASMMDQIILKKCSEAMLNDFSKAGKTAPAGMVDDTCNCVVAQMKKRQSIDQAKTFCSQQSLKKYGSV